MVLHSNRMEGLRDLLVQFVKNDPLPPLSAETILVQSNGMKHWLTLALADDQALGICAATELVLPSAQLWQIYRSVLGADRLPSRMPLDKSPLVWRILRRMPAWLTDPRFAPLAHYLGDDTQGTRAYGLAQQLADVLDGYQNYRADWLDHWAQGHDRLHGAHALPAEHLWQAAMWRDLLNDLQSPSAAPLTGFQARSDVHKAFMRTLSQHPAGQALPGVPERLLVFGITALPMQTLEALVALGRFIPVLMFVHNPSQAHWGHLTDSPVPEGHPLLAAWGKHGRDYLHAIDQFEQANPTAPPFARVDAFIDPAQEATDAEREPTVLEQLQSAVLHLQTPPPLTPAGQALRTPEDHSVRFAQAHSAQREVEVLHDQLLAWLDEDPSLQPRDIMVMVPDMAQFAPHIHAVFGRFASQGGQSADSRYLPYSVADTTAHLEPLVQALQTLLQLPQLRFGLGEWLALFQVQAVRARYGLDVADVQDLHTLLNQAGVRWGLDAMHRQTWGMDSAVPDSDQNSWHFGLQRLLMGYATGRAEAAQHPWQNTLAQAGLQGLDARVVSALLQWLADTQLSLSLLQQDHTPSVWVRLMHELVRRFFKTEDEASQRLLERVMAPLEDWLADTALAQFDQPVPLSVVRNHWMAHIDTAGLQQRFMGGGVQFATLMPMRAIPFKRLCLLGMNDGDYPRAPAPRDFDLMSHPTLGRAGDRARREDDRYLFLEALLSARERLYISWQGRRASDHAELPPSVLVAQLLDHLRQCHVSADGSEAFPTPLQPLQPFSPKYFRQGSGFVTYAHDWDAAQQPLSKPILVVPNVVATPPTVLTEQDLQRLLRQPVDVHFTDHLHVELDEPQALGSEDEPFEPQGLEAFVLKAEVLNHPDPQAALRRLYLQGQLALGGFGQTQQNDWLALREQVHQRLSGYLFETDQALPEQVHVMQAATELRLHFGGDANTWRKQGQTALQIDLRPSKIMNGKAPRLHTLTRLWVGHLSANAAGLATTSLQSGEDGLLILQALTPEEAQSHLADLAEVYLQAWQAPLPLACKTACAWLAATHWPSPKARPKTDATQADTAESDAERLAALAMFAAQQAFDGGFFTGEASTSAHLQRAFERFEDIQDHLVTWAQRVYGPLASACTVAGSATPAEDAA